MKKITIVIFFSLLFISCYSAHKKKVDSVTLSLELKENEFEIDDYNIKLIERSLNHISLKEYYHFELEGRTPLFLLFKKDNQLVDYSIKCFGQPIEIINSAKNINKDSVMELTHANQSKDRISLTFFYPVEGIKFTIEYKIVGDKSWKEVKP